MLKKDADKTVEIKAISICPICNQELITDCEACISAGTDIHICKNIKETEVIEGIKWNVIKETNLLKTLKLKLNKDGNPNQITCRKIVMV